MLEGQEEPPTHALIARQLGEVAKSLEAHREATRARDEEIMKRFEAGSNMFIKVTMEIVFIKNGIVDLNKALAKHGDQLVDLQAAENIRKGERGVIKAILGSKPMMWLAGAVVGLVVAVQSGFLAMLEKIK